MCVCVFNRKSERKRVGNRGRERGRKQDGDIEIETKRGEKINSQRRKGHVEREGRFDQMQTAALMHAMTHILSREK